MSQRNSMERRERRRKRKEQKRQKYLELGFAPKAKKVRRNKSMNRHHLINACRKGTWDYHNILWIYINRHQTWHSLFKNLNLDEVIELLIRVKSAKENQIEPHPR